jgi:hypothetical protein
VLAQHELAAVGDFYPEAALLVLGDPSAPSRQFTWILMQPSSAGAMRAA